MSNISVQKEEETAIELVDPVYGMTVPADGKLHLIHNSKTYRFCSEHCLHKIKKHPVDYLNKATTNQSVDTHASVDETTTYTYPIHPEVEQQGSGTSPKCGMALEPKAITTESEYTCPIHPVVALLFPVIFPPAMQHTSDLVAIHIDTQTGAVSSSVITNALRLRRVRL